MDTALVAPKSVSPPRRRFHIPAEGRYWLALTALLLVIGLLKGINLLTLLGCIMLGVAALQALLAGRRLGSLRARRRIAEPVFAGVTSRIEVEVTNPTWGARRGVTLEDTGADHALRWFAYRLERRRTAHFRHEVVLPRRGRYRWGPLWAVSGYPFGLFQRRALLADGGEVIVLPRLGWLHRGRLRRHLCSLDPTSERARQHPRRHPNAQAEFHGLRAYRPGDSPRAIHWRTSARCGQWMVREYEDVPSDNLLLVFDPTLPPDRPDIEGTPALEAAVSLAATIAWEWCRRKGDRLVFALAGPEPVVLDGLTGTSHGVAVLKHLAVQQGTSGVDAQALLARLAAEPLPPAGVLVVGAGESALAAPLRQALRRPVACLDASRLGEMTFYDPPTEGASGNVP
jgi:uncharacterized protein (DUF58 family)